MIIKDLDYGHDLRLLKGRLEETISNISMYPYHVLFSDLRAAVKARKGFVTINGKDMMGIPNAVNVALSLKHHKIGCRTFSPETFAKILKAAGVRKKKPTKKVARKGK